VRLPGQEGLQVAVTENGVALLVATDLFVGDMVTEDNTVVVETVIMA
jgi:hypothetical protein